MKTEVILGTCNNIRLEDLKNTDHVGFLLADVEGKNYKGNIVKVTDIGFVGIVDGEKSETRPNFCLGVRLHNTLKDVLVNHKSNWSIVNVIVFDTRQELYEWQAL